MSVIAIATTLAAFARPARPAHEAAATVRPVVTPSPAVTTPTEALHASTTTAVAHTAPGGPMTAASTAPDDPAPAVSSTAAPPATTAPTTEVPEPTTTAAPLPVGDPVDLDGPTLPIEAADPELASGPDGLYLFTTNAGGRNVPVYRQVRGGWEQLADALPQVGSWARGGSVWAPGVAYLGGRWRLLYTATDSTTGHQCIGIASADSIRGPYADAPGAGPLMCQSNYGGSIDPSPFIERDGSITLLWKSDGNSVGGPTIIWAAPMARSGDALAGAPVAVLTSDRVWDTGIIENPDLVRTPAGLLLFFSGGRYGDDSYATGYAVCEHPLGPCARRSWLAPLWRSGGVVTGPGGASFTATRDGIRVAIHGWYGGVGYRRGMRSTWVGWLDLPFGNPVLRSG